MTLTGADTDALRRLASDFSSGASELQQLSAELARTIDAAESWQGPDAVRCKEQLGELARARITGVADALETAGALLQREAADQDTASGETPAQQRPGLLAQVVAWGKAAFGAVGLAGKLGVLRQFLSRATGSFLGRTRAGIRAVEKIVGMGDLGLRAAGRFAQKWGVDLSRVVSGLTPAAKVLSRVLAPVGVVLSLPDIVDGGGYTSWRGGITQVLTAANAVAVTGLTIAAMTVGTAAAAASAPLLVGAAGVAVGVYGAWSVGNALWDAAGTNATLAPYRDRFAEAVSQRATSVWQGARSILDVSTTFARGVLGPAPAGATR